MNVLEEGVLLLCCRLGDKTKKALTAPQFRDLSLRVVGSLIGGNHLTQVKPSDLCAIGCSEAEAERIIDLLDRQEQLQSYLAAAEAKGIYPITRVSDGYPKRITEAQTASRPPVLFAMGEKSLLQRPGIAVVGSRKLREENRAFAEQAGRRIAQEGYVLISGGADGADTAAQEACLAAGGSCVIFVPDRLDAHTPHERILYISEDGYDIHFSAHRALHRNGLIHMQAEKTLAVQSSNGSGGTWRGCTDNLKHGWSELFVFDDGSDAAKALMELGATGLDSLQTIAGLSSSQTTLF